MLILLPERALLPALGTLPLVEIVAVIDRREKYHKVRVKGTKWSRMWINRIAGLERDPPWVCLARKLVRKDTGAGHSTVWHRARLRVASSC